ncbi:MAG: OmpA family protein [Myxococcota bacterium]
MLRRVGFVLAVLIAAVASAQERGFAAHRFDGSAVGSRLFLLERPWYSSTRVFAVGVTADYSHAPLVPRLATGRGELAPIVAHALVGHAELAVSLFDRLTLKASLPVTFLESGQVELVSQAAPLAGVGLGDPRAGLMLRVFGQPERDAISLHIGADVWIPLGAQATHQGDGAPRFLPRLVFAGAFGVGRWTLDAGFLFRGYASIGPPALGMTAASELRTGFALGASLFDDRLSIGPEARFAMQVVGDHAFAVNGMNLELLGGLSYAIADRLQLGLAGGTGLFGAAGTPDARAIVRLAWAPRGEARAESVLSQAAPDADADGVVDELDRCPFEPETTNGIRDADGCPEYQLEPGAPLARVLNPTVNVRSVTSLTSPSDAGVVPVADAGIDPGAARALAFATSDSDDDGVPDEADACPVTAEDADGFEDEDGCPELDNDRDGLVDARDRCPVEAETFNGEQDDDGCPDTAPDADADGVADLVDRCPFEPETRDGVRDEDGCPELQVSDQPALSRLLAEPPAPTAGATEREGSRLTVAARDSDADGVVDDDDRCPITAEDRDGFEDDDGCPEPDNDDDQISDSKDRCADVAETINGWQDDDGCPDEHPDVDGDGVDFIADRCPLEPGDKTDGCPHLPFPALVLPGFSFSSQPPAAAALADAASGDLDRDGTPDDADRCPLTREDPDQFEDEDGCPEPDNDRDGVEDAKDRCPFESETINGAKDDDGCPDKGEALVHVTATAVVIDKVIRFKTASATLERDATPLLQQVAATLKAARTLSIEIQGHTDDVGNAAANIRLSKRRAETIRAFLIKAGIAPNRLLANGFGPTRPIATNKTEKGREQNRRVDFLILGEAK